MQEKDPNEFTEREKFILSYYRSLGSSRGGQIWFYDIATGVVSLACLVMFWMKEDPGYVFVGYMLLIGRLYYVTVEGGRWTQDFRNIFVKYDAKLKALTEATKGKERE